MSTETCTNTVFQPKTYQKTFAGSLVASTGESPNFNHIFHIPTKGRHRGRSHGDGLPRRPIQAVPETVMKGRRVRVVSEANDRADRCGQETNRLSRPQPVQPAAASPAGRSQSSRPQPVQPAQPGTSQPTRPARAVYFMPVIAMPSTKRFCTKKNTMSNGRAEISAPAITTPYGVTDEP